MNKLISLIINNNNYINNYYINNSFKTNEN